MILNNAYNFTERQKKILDTFLLDNTEFDEDACCSVASLYDMYTISSLLDDAEKPIAKKQFEGYIIGRYGKVTFGYEKYSTGKKEAKELVFRGLAVKGDAR